jgi:hypothetical protein
MRLRLPFTLALLLVSGCSCATPDPTDGGGTDGPRADVPGLDAPEPDVPGLDAPRPDAPSGPACDLPVAFDVGLTPTRTLHVAPGGTGDGSAGSPLGDIEAAVRMATPGTEVLVHAGTYAGNLYVENVHGSATAPIWLRGEAGAVIDAGMSGEVLHVTEASYFVIEGIEMRNGATNGLNMDDGGTYDTPTHHVVLRNLYVHDVGTGGNNDCIKLSGVDDFFVLGSRIARCNAGDGIDQVGCHRGFLHGNTFSELSGGGIQMKGGSSDSLVHGNRFENVAGRGINAGGSTGLSFFRPIDAPFEAARLTLEANVFVTVGSDGGAPIAFVGCDGCQFIHNTVIDPQTWVARILQESVDARFVPCRNGVFANNIVVFDSADLRTFVNVGGNTAPDTFTFRNNQWFARDDPGFTGPSLDPAIPPETGTVVTDPALTSDGHACGPVAGEALPSATADFDGTCWDEPPTRGAFVFVSCTL